MNAETCKRDWPLRVNNVFRYFHPLLRIVFTTVSAREHRSLRGLIRRWSLVPGRSIGFDQKSGAAMDVAMCEDRVYDSPIIFMSRSPAPPSHRGDTFRF
jgi:hypothetical protein